MRTLLRTRFRPMELGDIPQVMEIERESFPSAWPSTAYRRELQNSAARYMVLTALPDEDAAPLLAVAEPAPSHSFFGALRRRAVARDEAPASRELLLGFAGVWLMVGEAHIVTIATRASHRRMGIGERLLIACIETAQSLDQEVVTLEVRKSNEAAQALYAKYGFDRVGLRVRYYTDNQEDAVIMTTPEIASPAYVRLFEELRERHRAAHPDLEGGGWMVEGGGR
jgi:ribosomal-protein-alanine N-acetyltransferase